MSKILTKSALVNSYNMEPKKSYPSISYAAFFSDLLVLISLAPLKSRKKCQNQIVLVLFYSRSYAKKIMNEHTHRHQEK